jgi:hypothetical protein
MSLGGQFRMSFDIPIKGEECDASFCGN